MFEIQKHGVEKKVHNRFERGMKALKLRRKIKEMTILFVMFYLFFKI